MNEKVIRDFVEKGKNFQINFGYSDFLSYEIAFDVLRQIDKIINGNFLSLSKDDFEAFKEDGEIDLVLGTQGYSAQFFEEQHVLKMVFVEGGLE